MSELNIVVVNAQAKSDVTIMMLSGDLDASTYKTLFAWTLRRTSTSG